MISELNLIGLEIQDLSPLLQMPLRRLGISRSSLKDDQIKILKQLDLKNLYSANDPVDQKPIDFFKKIVDEKNVAWHAGISNWKGDSMLNKNSIGIELDNIGHGLNYKIFSNIQMSALERLLKLLINKYKIKKQNVLGHSDIAPDRKLDPGELFNWNRLAKKNLAYYPLVKKNIFKNNKTFFKLGDKSTEIKKIKLKLIKIGYKCSKDNYFDINLKLVVEAFQRRFLPEKINGIIDGKVYSRILDVCKNA